MPNKKEVALINFKKAQGLISKVVEMIENDEYCINIMQQNLAVIGLLKSAHKMLMEGHLNSCFLKAMETKDSRKKKKMVEEILRVAHLFNK